MVPLIPIFVIVVLLAGGGTVIITSTRRKKVKGSSLGVLGTTKAGKTSFLYRLGLVERDGGDGDGDRTVEEEYVTPAIIKTSKGVINILPGKDYGGTLEMQKKHTAEICDNCDIVIYIFDGNKYLLSSYYKGQINALLKVIYQRFEKSKKDYKNAVIIASKADLYEKRTEKNRKEMLKEIKAKVRGDKLALLESNMYCINCTSKEEVIRIAEILFEKGLFK